MKKLFSKTHRHAWSPWRLEQFKKFRNNTSYEVTLQVRNCVDPNCNFTEAAWL